MAFNGSGVFNLYTPGNPVVTATTISTTWANNTLSDLATGLSTAIAKDGQTTTTAKVPFAFGIDVSTAITTASTSFTAFAGATTLLTIGGTGATSVFAVPGTKEATNSTTGAFTVAGGLAVAKKLFVGGTADIAGDFSVATSKFTVNASTGAAVFAGAVSGITTLSASGPITSLKAHSGTLSLQPRIQIKNATAGTTFTGRYQFVDGDGNEGWEVATNAAVGSGYLEFNEGATNRAYFSPGGGLTVAGAISGTTGKFGGAENLKIWTYAHVITAAEITATLVNATITAVNTSNVRGLQITYRNAAGIVYTDAYATALTKYGSARMSSTTNVEIGLGVGAAANDVIYIVVLEAF